MSDPKALDEWLQVPMGYRLLFGRRYGDATGTWLRRRRARISAPMVDWWAKEWRIRQSLEPWRDAEPPDLQRELDLKQRELCREWAESEEVQAIISAMEEKEAEELEARETRQKPRRKNAKRETWHGYSPLVRALANEMIEWRHVGIEWQPGASPRDCRCPAYPPTA